MKGSGLLLKACALFFPWVVFFIAGRPIFSMCAMAAQATVIGWFPVSMMAFKELSNEQEET